jgi:hypothetical protein
VTTTAKGRLNTKCLVMSLRDMKQDAKTMDRLTAARSIGLGCQRVIFSCPVSPGLSLRSSNRMPVLTTPMELSPSDVRSKEMSCISWNPRSHYCFHKTPPPSVFRANGIQSQTSRPIYNVTFSLLGPNIHLSSPSPAA